MNQPIERSQLAGHRADMSDSTHIFEGLSDNFDALVMQKSEELPVLVDFWASWCSPCQILMPIVTRLADEYAGKFHLVKVNSDEQQALAHQYGVRSLPTLKLFRHGRVVEELMGAQPEPVIRQLLDKFVEVQKNPLLSQAQEFVQHGQLEQARRLMTQALEAEPGNQQITMELIGLLVMLDELEAAESMILALPAESKDCTAVSASLARIEFTRITRQSPEPTELENNVADDPSDLLSRYQLAARQALDGRHEAAMLELLAIMKKDRHWRDGATHKAMLAVFTLIPEETELVNKYRRRVFNLLH